MATETEITGIDPQVMDDLRAVIKHLMDKTPLEPELARRIDERADRVTERLRRENVDIDVVELLREVRDEE
ncbi:hypothetical protein HY256_02095 [Candidatus Sumerlaeota bacterium]|nr:hypothetical protein [Planctomycetota bacterium]MBI3735286.1 hypothetical protein [Candidatus Sumerlaeota bacterium]